MEVLEVLSSSMKDSEAVGNFQRALASKHELVVILSQSRVVFQHMLHDESKHSL